MSPRLWLALFLVPIVTPWLVFVISGLTVGMSLPAAVSAAVEQSGERRQNPLVVGVPGIVPALLVALLLLILRKWDRSGERRRVVGWVGVSLIGAVIAWSNFQFWPRFLPSRESLMWPHGLELVIGPLFFAPVVALVGCLLTWFLTRGRA